MTRSQSAVAAALLGSTAFVMFGPAAAQSPAAPGATATASAPASGAGLTASGLRNQPVYNAAGQEVGRVGSVVIGPDNQAFAVVSSGTLGNRQVLVPANRLTYQNNRFVAGGYTEEQLRGLPAYTTGAGGYRSAEDTYGLTVTGYTAQAGQAGQREGTNITVQQPAPAIRVEQASPQITVQQAQPQVSVRQAQPEILVRQPAPTVTVDIPQPEIIVRMPQPEVNVAQAQPQVDVRQAQPNVQVVQPAQPQVQVTPAQPQVNVQQQANAQPNVQVQQAEGQANVRYERAEPKVTVNQPQGQPNVRIEQQGEPGQPAQAAQQPSRQQAAATAGAVPAAGAATGAGRAFNVTELEDMDIYTAQGTKLGDVDDVLIGPDNKVFVVMEYGGFLGIGQRKATMAVDQLTFRDNRLYTNMTEAQLRALPPFERVGQGYRAAETAFRTEVNPFRQ